MRQRRANGGAATGDGVVTDNDEDLLERARHGDRSAFGTLYLRHQAAARRVAGRWAASAADAEDAVAEAFAKVFAVLPRKAKGEVLFRRYLFTAVRNAATDRTRRERRIDLGEAVPETAADDRTEDPTLLGFERDLLAEALQGLPARWRTILWLTEVEGLSPAEVAQQFHMTPNAVAAVAYRARKGLRRTYLQAHLRLEPGEQCRDTVGRLGEYVLGGLQPQNRVEIDAHLRGCMRCRQRSLELVDVTATLRRALAPVAPLFGRMTELPWAPPPGTSRPFLKAAAGAAAAILALAGPADGPQPTAPTSPMAEPVVAAAAPPSVPAAPPPSLSAASPRSGPADGRKEVMGVLRQGVLNQGDLRQVADPVDVHLDTVLPLVTPLGPELDIAATAVAFTQLRELPDTVDGSHAEIRAATVSLPVSLPVTLPVGLPVSLPERARRARGRAATSVPALVSRRLGPSRLNIDGIVKEAVRGAMAGRGARMTLVQRRGGAGLRDGDRPHRERH
jgi:RNA polymerase sigma factor (sigma-70 family)